MPTPRPRRSPARSSRRCGLRRRAAIRIAAPNVGSLATAGANLADAADDPGLDEDRAAGPSATASAGSGDRREPVRAHNAIDVEHAAHLEMQPAAARTAQTAGLAVAARAPEGCRPTEVPVGRSARPTVSAPPTVASVGAASSSVLARGSGSCSGAGGEPHSIDVDRAAQLHDEIGRDHEVQAHGAFRGMGDDTTRLDGERVVAVLPVEDDGLTRAHDDIAARGRPRGSGVARTGQSDQESEGCASCAGKNGSLQGMHSSGRETGIAG